jgi:uncharacterized membrane protein YbaN (DUF454 family)
MSKRGIFFIFGWMALGLGFIGAFLPLLPTTPFVLLAAYLFSKSSTKWHNWLLSHPTFGSSIRDWQEHRLISKRSKVIAITAITLSFSLSLFVTSHNVYINVFLIMVAVGVIIFILSCPSSIKRHDGPKPTSLPKAKML